MELLICNKIKVTGSCKTEYDVLFLSGFLALKGFIYGNLDSM